MHGAQAIENAAPATIGPPVPARAISASTRHSRFSRATNIEAMNSTPITIISAPAIFSSVRWLSRSVSPIAVAVRPRRMKMTENEAMKRSAGTSTRRVDASSSSFGGTPVIAAR